mmetsp:Transcript_64287/g.191993  ORF Transcript_64287/g.191993 Transcript_64287/m.191993 type:complete len:252 (+) Transcript_64287:546-1301(+)
MARLRESWVADFSRLVKTSCWDSARRSGVSAPCRCSDAALALAGRPAREPPPLERVGNEAAEHGRRMPNVEPGSARPASVSFGRRSPKADAFSAASSCCSGFCLALFAFPKPRPVVRIRWRARSLNSSQSTRPSPSRSPAAFHSRSCRAVPCTPARLSALYSSRFVSVPDRSTSTASNAFFSRCSNSRFLSRRCWLASWAAVRFDAGPCCAATALIAPATASPTVAHACNFTSRSRSLAASPSRAFAAAIA